MSAYSRVPDTYASQNGIVAKIRDSEPSISEFILSYFVRDTGIASLRSVFAHVEKIAEDDNI